jgi:CRISPR-associated endonuclease Cas2
MLVMLAYDVPEQKHQSLLRKEFERLGGSRVQYSIYVFEGEDHECQRIIRYMRRVSQGIEGDIRIFPMERSAWEAQIMLSGMEKSVVSIPQFPRFVEFW